MKEGIGHSFQSRTKHRRDRMEPHFLDWENQPSRYKEYPEAPELALPAPELPRSTDLNDVIGNRRSVRIFSKRPVTVGQLSGLLWASTGITKRTRDFEYRAAPSAGALYPMETYLVVNDVDGIEPGIYHYPVRTHTLQLLRRGDFREQITAAALDQNIAGNAAVVFVWTAVFQRSEWKYRQRAYRYVYLDCGHIAGQLSLSAVALGLGSCNIGAIYDDEVNGLLGVDGEEESAIYLCAVGRSK